MKDLNTIANEGQPVSAAYRPPLNAWEGVPEHLHPTVDEKVADNLFFYGVIGITVAGHALKHVVKAPGVIYQGMKAGLSEGYQRASQSFNKVLKQYR